MIDEKHIMRTLKELAKVPSISGTSKENLAADKIYDLLSDIEYFKNNKNNLNIHPIENDIYKRTFVSAFLKGKKESKDIVILTGHFDVVDIQEFGELKDIAFDIDKCTENINKLPLEKDALKDFKSKDWIFGRGSSDMKYGLALYIELLREFSKKRDFKGNILFLAVSGEESNSEGMLSAVSYLSSLKDKGYKFKTLFLSECSTPKHEGENKKRIYIGSVGKIMPTFFCVGKATHVGNSFGGLNPNLMISEVNRLMEYNMDFSDSFGEDITLPPSCLKQEDLKDLYSVQTPLYSYAYYNLLTLKMKPEEIMEKLKLIANNAFENTIKIFKDNYEKYSDKISKESIEDLDIKPCILTYEKLYKEVEKLDKDFSNKIDKMVCKWKKEKLDNQTISINIIKETYENYPNKKPMIIIAYNVPYYPHKYLNSDKKEDKYLLDKVEDIINYARDEYNIEIEKENFFMGISDLSYTGLSKDFNIDSICENMVGINSTYMFPEKELKKLNIPSIVFGGYGKDFHKYSERLNIPYSMGIVPNLYVYALNSILK